MENSHRFQVQQELGAKLCSIGSTEGSKGTFMGLDKPAGQEGREEYAAAC